MTQNTSGCEHFHQDGTADITRRSVFTGEIHTRTLPITFEQFIKWQRGHLIQDCFPHLSAPDREFLKTGITAEEWNNVFKQEL